MERHRLGIGRLATECTLVGRPELAVVLERRLERALADGLPRHLATLTEPVLEGHDGVIRLERLRVRLSVEAALDEGELARVFASQITAALREALGSSRFGRRHWPDWESYAAAYLLHRLGLASEPDWAFPDFAPLRYLSGVEAAIEVLATRPGILGPLARSAPLAGAPAGLASLLTEEQAVGLVSRWSAVVAESDGVAAEAVVRAMTPELAEQLAGPEPGRAVVTLALATAAQPVPTGPTVQAVLELANLTLALLTLPEEVTALAPAEIVARLIAGPTTVSGPWPELDDALRAAASGPAARSRLEALIPRLQDALAQAGVTPTVPSSTTATGSARTSTQPSELATDFAGLGLLLPSVIRLATPLSPGQVQALIMSFAPDQEAASEDPAVRAMLPPPDAEPVPWPEPPPNPTIAEEARFHLDGTWAGLILADFATRLPGLTGSSRPYLTEQFLTQPGRITLTPETLRIQLDGPPLGIVLQMSGLIGPQGGLPQHGNRQLLIENRGAT